MRKIGAEPPRQLSLASLMDAVNDGHGLGLTIVATIAKLHGGTLSSEDVASGVRAGLTLQRS